ncbi:hypothetical protein [Priestia megaterium]|uniref:hypothetical protein n=1 Tax=Priestia megaterium TaxID=1404 RepID=UPI001A952F68|nr:hypothetical protein [Priestia megaterium]QSX24461.1 hypothetical protein J0P05_33065 [Priestia megaterium]
MNELGIRIFKNNVKLGDEISVATVLKDYDGENISYHGKILELRDEDFLLQEPQFKNIPTIIDYKDVYWHSAETVEL